MKLNLMLAAILMSTSVFAQEYKTNPHTSEALSIDDQKRHELWISELVQAMRTSVPGNCKLLQTADGTTFGYGENYSGPTVNLYLNMNGQNVKMELPLINGVNETRSGILFAGPTSVAGEYHIMTKFWKKNYSNQSVDWRFFRNLAPGDVRDGQWINEEQLIIARNVSGKIGFIHYTKIEAKDGNLTPVRLVEQHCQ